MSASATANWGAVEWSLYEKVRAYVADAADVELDRVEPDTDIFRDLGVDSLGLTLVLVNLEDEFNIDEPDDIRELGPSLNTPVAIVSYALAAVQDRG